MPRIFPSASSRHVEIEHGYPGEVLGRVRAFGWEPGLPGDGYARLYVVARVGDVWVGAADPRHDGGARGSEQDFELRAGALPVGAGRGAAAGRVRRRNSAATESRPGSTAPPPSTSRSLPGGATACAVHRRLRPARGRDRPRARVHDPHRARHQVLVDLLAQRARAFAGDDTPPPGPAPRQKPRGTFRMHAATNATSGRTVGGTSNRTKPVRPTTRPSAPAPRTRAAEVARAEPCSKPGSGSRTTRPRTSSAGSPPRTAARTPRCSAAGRPVSCCRTACVGLDPSPRLPGDGARGAQDEPRAPPRRARTMRHRAPRGRARTPWNAAWHRGPRTAPATGGGTGEAGEAWRRRLQSVHDRCLDPICPDAHIGKIVALRYVRRYTAPGQSTSIPGPRRGLRSSINAGYVRPLPRGIGAAGASRQRWHRSSFQSRSELRL